VFNSFGCSGENVSPQISWSNVPAGTKSFAVTVYDPDAPTGSGWWHWLVVNIPTSYKSLPANFAAQDSFALKDGIAQVRNDFGTYKFGGPCPPQGDKPHRYIFTIYALKTDKLDLSESSTAALAGFMINRNVLAKAQFSARYGR
jgi:Raf kinase inhibitor-like YbhB/YbcL family protein